MVLREALLIFFIMLKHMVQILTPNMFEIIQMTWVIIIIIIYSVNSTHSVLVIIQKP